MLNEEKEKIIEEINNNNIIDMSTEHTDVEHLNDPDEQKMSDEEFEQKSEQVLNTEEQKALFLKQMRERVDLKIRTMLSIPDKEQQIVKGTHIYMPNIEDHIEPLVRTIVQKNKGFARVIYTMNFDINKKAPIVLYGYLKINKEINSIVMKIIYGHGDFPDGSLVSLPLNETNILWYNQNDFLEICSRIEQYRLNEFIKKQRKQEQEEKEN